MLKGKSLSPSDLRKNSTESKGRSDYATTLLTSIHRRAWKVYFCELSLDAVLRRFRPGSYVRQEATLAVAGGGVGAPGGGVPAVLSGAMISMGRLLGNLGS